MKEKLTPPIIGIILTLILSGCTSTGGQRADQRPTDEMGNIVLVDPGPADFRNQMALARYSHILAEAENITTDQKAELLYRRGELYDRMGMRVLARFDFDSALKLKPDMAEAHNFVGIHHTQNGNYVEAYDAFDSTLEIDPEHDFALLNRGIALYYGGRPGLATNDIEEFYGRDPTDPYRALWYYIIERANDSEKALAFLSIARLRLSNNNWASQIVDFYLGEVTEEELLDNTVSGASSQEELADRLCEVYFYLGKYHSARSKFGKAKNYFKLTLSTNVYEYVEHRYARVELNLLREQQIN